jgi:hypothetical protein
MTSNPYSWFVLGWARLGHAVRINVDFKCDTVAYRAAMGAKP